MAEEQTTQQDSTNSGTTDAVTDAASEASAEQQATTDAEAGDKGADAGDEAGDETVIGADVTDEAAEKADEADEKSGDADEPEGPPEKYELALEGVTLDEEAVAAAEPVFRELNLSNDQANKLMPVAKDFAERTAEATLRQVIDAGQQQKKDWLDAFKADAEIGGAKAEETTHLAAKALDALGYTLTGFGDDKKQPHPFRKVLTETGFGNHPDMIRMARKLGELVSEDGFVRANAGTVQKADRLEALYPEDVPK